jgi:hypothetical protein
VKLDESEQIHGRAEGVRHQKGQRRQACGREPPQSRDEPDDLSQLEEEVYWAIAKRDERLEDENGRLRRIVADLTLDRETVSL